jgi:hypothetical protein
MPPTLPPVHDDLTFLGPLSPARAEELVGFLAGIDAGLVVDLGCGWAELLLRTVAARPGLRGHGVDRDAEKVAHGCTLARARGLADRVELVVGDAGGPLTQRPDALICILPARSGVRRTPWTWTTRRRCPRCAESGYSWGFHRWLMAHPADHPDAERVRGMAADHAGAGCPGTGVCSGWPTSG